MGGANQFVITEIGLPWGGMFDVDGDWTAPHQLHRFGRQLDLRSQVDGTNIFDLVRWKALVDACASEDLTVHQEPDHYHLSLGAP